MTVETLNLLKNKIYTTAEVYEKAKRLRKVAEDLVSRVKLYPDYKDFTVEMLNLYLFDVDGFSDFAEKASSGLANNVFGKELTPKMVLHLISEIQKINQDACATLNVAIPKIEDDGFDSEDLLEWVSDKKRVNQDGWPETLYWFADKHPNHWLSKEYKDYIERNEDSEVWIPEDKETEERWLNYFAEHGSQMDKQLVWAYRYFNQ